VDDVPSTRIRDALDTGRCQPADSYADAVGSHVDRPASGVRTNEGVTLVDRTEAVLAAADAVVILADHDTFDYALVEGHARYVFDTRNRCRGPNVEAL
jgi:UDP-N-acetyl-D-mannosaminuronate dehydrogenase